MKFDYIYLAKPKYGGWVTFTAHLLKQKNVQWLYKIGKTLQKGRAFGYDLVYQNIPPDGLGVLKNHFVLCIDKHHFEFTKYLREPTIVLHDTIEMKKDIQPFLAQCKKIIVIRQQIKDYLKESLDLDSEYKYHPFFPYPTKKSFRKNRAVAISRVDWDKHTDIICQANKIVKNPIHIFGAVNRLYEHIKLEELNFQKYYAGQFDLSFNAVADILCDSKYMVDLTYINHDGGGTQYTFLEAIHNDACLILNRKWLEIKQDFKEDYNCLAVDTPEELAEIIKSKRDVSKLVRHAKKLLKRHIDVKW